MESEPDREHEHEPEHQPEHQSDIAYRDKLDKGVTGIIAGYDKISDTPGIIYLKGFTKGLREYFSEKVSIRDIIISINDTPVDPITDLSRDDSDSTVFDPLRALMTGNRMNDVKVVFEKRDGTKYEATLKRFSDALMEILSNINIFVDSNEYEGKKLNFTNCKSIDDNLTEKLNEPIYLFLSKTDILLPHEQQQIIIMFSRLLDKNMISLSKLLDIAMKIQNMVESSEISKKKFMCEISHELIMMCVNRNNVKAKILSIQSLFFGNEGVYENKPQARQILQDLSDKAIQNNVIVVKNLKNNVTKDELQILFSPYGVIARFDIFGDGPCFMCAHITYSTRDDVERCIRFFRQYDNLTPQDGGVSLNVVSLMDYDNLELMLKIVGRSRDEELTLIVLKIASYAGNTLAMCMLGHILISEDPYFKNSKDSKKVADTEEGYRFLNDAVDMGNLCACKVIGLRMDGHYAKYYEGEYFSGDGVFVLRHARFLQLLPFYKALRIFEDVPEDFMCIAMALNTMGRNDLLINFVHLNPSLNRLKLNDKSVYEQLKPSNTSSTSSTFAEYINDSIFDLRSQEWYVFKQLFNRYYHIRQSNPGITDNLTDTSFYNDFLTLSQIKTFHKKALTRFTEYSNRSSAGSGLNLLGIVYFEGTRVKRNREEAFKLWTEGHGKGASDSTLNLAKMWYYCDTEVPEIGVFNSNDLGRLKKAKDLFKEVEHMTDAKIMLAAIYLRLAYMFKSSDEKTSSLPFAKTKHVYYTDKSSEYQVKVKENAERLKNGETYTNKLQFIVKETKLESELESKSGHIPLGELISFCEMLYNYGSDESSVVDKEYILYKAYGYLMRYIRSDEIQKEQWKEHYHISKDDYENLTTHTHQEKMPEKIKAIEMIKDIQRIFWGSAKRAPLVGGIIPGNVGISLSSEHESALPQPQSQGGSKSRRRRRSRRRLPSRRIHRSRRRRPNCPSRPSRPSRRRRRRIRGPISRSANKKSRKGCKSRRSSRP